MHENIGWPALLAYLSRTRHLSQGAVADAIGVDQSTISRIASGDVKDPRASVAFRLLTLAGGRVEFPDVDSEFPPAGEQAQ